MARIYTYLVLICLVNLNISAQTIQEFSIEQNLEDFDFAIRELETSYSGFDVYVNQSTQQEYDSIVANLRNQIETQNRPGYDAALYLYSWFNDGHLGINLKYHRLSEQYMSDKKKYHPYAEIDEYDPMPLFVKATDKTFLIRIPEFNEEVISFSWIDNAIDEFNKSKCDNLILDLRCNLGGDERYWHPLLPLLFDHKGTCKSVEYRMSDKNIEFLKIAASEYPEAQMILDSYNQTHKPYILFDDKEDINIEIKPYAGRKPSKVAIIIDGNCASATESLLLQSKAISERTKVYGKEGTQGCLDCAVVRETTKLPNSGFSLLIPICRTYNIPENGIDKTGIAPDVIIPIAYPKIVTDNIDEWTIWVASELEK